MQASVLKATSMRGRRLIFAKNRLEAVQTSARHPVWMLRFAQHDRREHVQHDLLKMNQ
jgi:hypothetical protein